MATRSCKYCKHSVAHNAKRCPGCGGKKPYPYTLGEYIGALVILILIIGYFVVSDAASRKKSTSDDMGREDGVAVNESSLATQPSWYHGSKPWMEIAEAGRREILRAHAEYERRSVAADELSGSSVDTDKARAGEQLISRICTSYGLDDYYRVPSQFGSQMVVWLPESEWFNLDESEKESITAFMSSKYAHWGVGVGRISGRDIMADRLVIEH